MFSLIFSQSAPQATYILHSADLSNPLAPPDVSRRTALAVSAEFDAQASRERELGLPVTVMVADSEYGKAKMEVRRATI